MRLLVFVLICIIVRDRLKQPENAPPEPRQPIAPSPTTIRLSWRDRWGAATSALLLIAFPLVFATPNIQNTVDPYFSWFTGEVADRSQAAMLAFVTLVTSLWPALLQSVRLGPQHRAKDLMTTTTWVVGVITAVVTYLGALQLGTVEGMIGLTLSHALLIGPSLHTFLRTTRS